MRKSQLQEDEHINEGTEGGVDDIETVEIPKI